MSWEQVWETHSGSSLVLIIIIGRNDRVDDHNKLEAQICSSSQPQAPGLLAAIAAKGFLTVGRHRPPMPDGVGSCGVLREVNFSFRRRDADELLQQRCGRRNVPVTRSPIKAPRVRLEAHHKSSAICGFTEFRAWRTRNRALQHVGPIAIALRKKKICESASYSS